MQTISVSRFKDHALQLLDQVGNGGEGLLITKRGKPLAQVLPPRASGATRIPGKLKNTILTEKDIVSPLGPEEWEACR